jgi:hypothetical protein
LGPAVTPDGIAAVGVYGVSFVVCGEAVNRKVKTNIKYMYMTQEDLRNLKHTACEEL